MHYFKTLLRPLLRYKYFTLINMLGLSVGIICSMIIFIYTISHLSTDTFHRDAKRIYRLVLDIKTPSGTIEYEPGSSLPMHEALKKEFNQVEESAFCMKFYSAPTLTVHTNGREEKYREENTVAYADQSFLEMFSLEFLAGNKSIALMQPKQAVLSQALAAKYFGSVDAALGKIINVNNTAEVVVTGVFADMVDNSDLDFGMMISLSTLKILQPYYQTENFAWIGSNNWTFVKLKENVFEEDMTKHLTGFANKYLGLDLAHWHLRMQPLSDMHFDVRYDGAIRKSLLWTLSGVAVMLLLLVSVNYINLTIAQAHHRMKEIAIRKYLGGSKRQLFIQFMSETTLVVMVSVLFATVSVYVVLPVLNQWLGLQLRLEPFVNIRFVIYFLIFATTLILLAGYYPAIHLSRFNPLKAIAGNVTRDDAKQFFGKVLLIFQYTIALFFLINTTVIVKQVNFIFNNDLGFDKEHVVNVRVPRADYFKMQTFRNEVAGLSGVEAASLHNQPPIASGNDGGFITFDNRQHMEDFIVRERWADDNFLETYAMQLVAGRNLRMHTDTLAELLVNESLLSSLGISNPEEVLGKKMIIDNSATHGTIVGVVRDFHHRSLQNAIEPLVINPMKSIFNHAGIRLHPQTSDPTIAEIRNIYLKHFPHELFEISFLEDTVQRMYKVEDTVGKLMKLFSVVAIVISLVGIMGLSSFSNIRRTREIAIRKVLGATVNHVLTILCRQYLIFFSISLVIALPVSYLLVNAWLNEFAYHIAIDPMALLAPGILLIAMSIAFIYLQSLRTALVNVADAMKHD